MPSSELVTVQGTMQLQHNAAAAWSTWKAQAAAAGITFSIPDDGAYRDYADQAALKVRLGSQVADAGQSSHGYGTAVDINLSSAADWAVTHHDGSLWAQDRYFAGNPHNAANEWNHWHYIGPLTIAGGSAPVAARRQQEMELYGSSAPSPVPAKYLALNAGLTPGLPIYMLIPAIGIPRITEDQNLVSLWSQQIFGQPSASGVIQISWGWFDQMFTQQSAIATSLGA